MQGNRAQAAIMGHMNKHGFILPSPAPTETPSPCKNSTIHRNTHTGEGRGGERIHRPISPTGIHTLDQTPGMVIFPHPQHVHTTNQLQLLNTFFTVKIPYGSNSQSQPNPVAWWWWRDPHLRSSFWRLAVNVSHLQLEPPTRLWRNQHHKQQWEPSLLRCLSCLDVTNRR